MKVLFEQATAAHAEALAPRLRAECLRDVLAIGYPDGRSGLLAGIRAGPAYSAMLGDEVIAMFGVSSSAGEVWVLTSDAVTKRPRLFLRCCPEALELLFQHSNHLENFVDARFEACIRWLKWLGCEVGEPVQRLGGAFLPVVLRGSV